MSHADAITIRTAVGADIEAIMLCERRPGYEETVGRWSRDEHRAGMADPSHRYSVACLDDGSIAGFVMLQEIGSSGGGGILIRRIAVMEPGRGVGRALLDHVLAVIFDELGAHRARLTVRPGNARGIALYSSVGLSEDGTEQVVRNGQPAFNTIMSIDAAGYDRGKRRSQSP